MHAAYKNLIVRLELNSLPRELKHQFETFSKPTINRNWWFRWILVRRFRTISISIDRLWLQNWLFVKVLFYCLNSRCARGCFSGSVCESVFSDVDSDELEFIVNEEMQQYQIIHEAVIIQQNKEMNEIIGEGFHHKMTPSERLVAFWRQ